jgi:hypothetical protein
MACASRPNKLQCSVSTVVLNCEIGANVGPSRDLQSRSHRRNGQCRLTRGSVRGIK